MSVETVKKTETSVEQAARIHWAAAAGTTNPELEARFEAMRARNWITDRMVEQYQKHWHCNREQALERLLPKAGE
jgi:hypothetical protein